MKRSGKIYETKVDRKAIEKDRRIRMKGLSFKLVSLIPDHHLKTPKIFLSHQDQIQQAAAYIKILRERVEELERRKREMKVISNGGVKNAAANKGELPIVRVSELGCDLEVVLIRESGVNKKFLLRKVIGILEDGGAEVVTVNLSTVGDKIFYTLHAQVKYSRVGVDTSRITERMHELVF